MMIELNDDQARVLLRSLESTLSDLSVEIAGTDRKEYRDEIKHKRALLREVRAKLSAAS